MIKIFEDKSAYHIFLVCLQNPKLTMICGPSELFVGNYETVLYLSSALALEGILGILAACKLKATDDKEVLKWNFF